MRSREFVYTHPKTEEEKKNEELLYRSENVVVGAAACLQQQRGHSKNGGRFASCVHLKAGTYIREFIALAAINKIYGIL